MINSIYDKNQIIIYSFVVSNRWEKRYKGEEGGKLV